ncbi:MAG: FHA domain-containing protein, partial [Gammaproteobacteria bacterium]
MHLILKQIGTDEPAEIEIDGSLFAVGRYEPPFSEFERSRVARLSKRHARIFEQDARVYVADLGSTNGTFVNGKPVKGDPKALNAGDELSFGGLAYHVEIVGSPDVPTSEAPLRLALTPEANREVLEPIVISRFPFLINKHSDVFARYKEILPEQLSFISRRHAHFFIRDGAVYIEDLGSTNGTFVSGNQLEEHAMQLEDGDVVAFGGEHFVYRVHILESAVEGTTELPESLEGVDNADRTIFIDSPTSFVDIYVGSQESQEEAADEQAEADVEEVRKPPRTRAGRGLHLAGEMKRSLFGETAIRPGTKRALLGIVLIAAAGGGWYYWSGTEFRSMARSLADGEYLDAVTAADAYLAEHPEAREVRSMATEAMIKHVVPEWITHLRLEAFDEADALVESARSLGEHNPDDDDMLDVLAWRTRASRFLTMRQASVDLNSSLEDGAIPAELIDWWESDTRGHTRELLALSDLVPEFRRVREEIFSDVRQLHALQREQRPMREFVESLTTALGRRDTDEISRLIDEFHETNTLDASRSLSQDAARMEAVFQLLASERWLDAYDLLRDTTFLTLPFARHAEAMIGRDVPDAETVARYRQAQTAWRDGDTETALTVLESLAGKQWGSEADKISAHYRALLDGYEALLADRGRPGFDERFFAYYEQLDPDTDKHLADQLRAELAAA